MLRQNPWQNHNTTRHATAGEYFAARDFGDAKLLVVPGTSDASGETIMEWGKCIVDKFPEEDRIVAPYDATIAPLIGGKGARSYDASHEMARARTTEEIVRAQGRVALFAYSQGADGAWKGAVDAVEQGLVDPADLEVILWAHPQYPGGLKDTMQRKHKVTSALFRHAFEATMDGVWVPHPDICTTTIAMQGDPITDFPSVWPNPIRFASRFHAGFYMIHSGLGSESAAQFESLEIADCRPDPEARKTTHLTLVTRNPEVQRAERRRERRHGDGHATPVVA